jgi:hypothetical protein
MYDLRIFQKLALHQPTYQIDSHIYTFHIYFNLFYGKEEYIIFHSDLQVSFMYAHLIELCHSIAYPAS